MCSWLNVAERSPHAYSPCFRKYRPEWSHHDSPHAAPSSTGTPSGLAHLRVEIACLLGGQTVLLDPPCGDEKICVPVSPLSLRLGPVGRVKFELNRQPFETKCA